MCVRESELLVARSEPGVSRVVCFSPRHDLTIPRMKVGEIRNVVDVWVEEYASLGSQPWINHVEIFENRGAMMGASNPHPHCQIWANANVPNVPAREEKMQRAYLAEHGRCLLCDYAALETKLGERVVCENDGFAVVVPFWAVWPFETMLLSKRHLTAWMNYRTSSAMRLPISFGRLRRGTTICLKCRSRTRWDSIRRPPMASHIRSGISMRIICRPYCGRRPCRSLWWDTSCWPHRNGISHRKRRQKYNYLFTTLPTPPAGDHIQHSSSGDAPATGSAFQRTLLGPTSRR